MKENNNEYTYTKYEILLREKKRRKKEWKDK